MTLLLDYNLKIVTYWGVTDFWWRDKNLVGVSLLRNGDFSRWGGMSKFLAGGGDSPIPPVGKTLPFMNIDIYGNRQASCKSMHLFSIYSENGTPYHVP